MTNQRWRDRRDSYRPVGEVIATAEYDVAPIAEATAKGFVLAHHYSASYPAARFRFGLFRRSELVGVAVFSHPCNDRVLAIFGGAPAVELGRFVLLDEVPGNGETWFLARTFEQLRGKVEGIVSFSDPIPRTDLAGRTLFAGHIGTIYQAHNARYLGRGTARTLRLLPDGRVLSDRAIQKVRSGERGWRYASDLLVQYGADRLQDHGGAREWLARWMPLLTRSVRHPGNFRYAWKLTRRGLALPAGQTYPKKGG